jgi:hypothetical protein
MAKRLIKKAATGEFVTDLFRKHESSLMRRLRRQRALFLPRFVREVGESTQLTGSDQDRAHEIAIRWADLETSGELAKHNETSIDVQFLDQLFGEGLGYKLKTKSPTDYNLDHKFSVAGVGIADGVLGVFPDSKSPSVVIELKNAKTDLDRDRSNGRSAVQQCWDYLNAMTDCQWGIVSNFRSIRLYHRARSSQNYEEFTLQELRSRERFNEFYAIFERGGLIQTALRQPPRAATLMQKTSKRQAEVGDDLYELYRMQRRRMIDHLVKENDKSLDEAIRIAQKILDRVIFIAFCEDRGLLPEKCLEKAHTIIPPFSKVKNPKWQNFLGLFQNIDKGSEDPQKINRFNGGLFANDPEIDALELDDEPWTSGFKNFGNYDFSEEVNVEVLGQMFERSITELEKLRKGGLGALKGTMPKSAERKKFGIYYTPPSFTGLLVERTVDAVVHERFTALAAKHGVDPEAGEKRTTKSKLLAYWHDCVESIKQVTVCDPACGSGAFLFRAFDALDAHYKAIAHGLASAGESADNVRIFEHQISKSILMNNLYGIDLSLEGVEITQLALWIRSANQGESLEDLSKHIVRGNSLVTDLNVDPLALDWKKAFPSIFGAGCPGGFTCVIGNPPWERVKVQDREFFSLTDPETAQAVSAADRKKRIDAMPICNPELHAAYLAARDRAQLLSDYARRSSTAGGQFPLTGKGDINLYMLFAELASRIVEPKGLVGLLVPSGIASDDTTKEFFGELMSKHRLVSLYDFENHAGHFEDVHRAFKFTALVFGGTMRSETQADFVFFARAVEEVSPSNKLRHIPLSAADMKLLNPNTGTCPIFRTRRDADLTKVIYKRVPILIDESRKHGGNPWGIKFFRMFDQTNDAGHFIEAEKLVDLGFKLVGNTFIKGKNRALPLYEAKMIQEYDHRAAGVIVREGNWVRQGQTSETSLVSHQNPEFCVLPRWWVEDKDVSKAANGRKREWMLAYKDITSPTNQRTMIAAFIPWVGVVNSAPIMFCGPDITPRREACLLGNLNSIVYDFIARQKVGGVHLNYFIVEQLPTLPPDTFSEKCLWNNKQTLELWISERVLKLSCTAEDMVPLANVCKFEGSEGGGVHKWKEAERSKLSAELDAAFAHLYGLSEEDFVYVLSTFASLKSEEVDERLAAYRDLAS